MVPRRMLRVLAVVVVGSGLTLAVPTGSPAGATPSPASATSSQSYLPLPDPTCTPGALNPDVTQSTIGTTICVSGWTAAVRPPTSYTDALKVQQIAAYGYSDTATADYEEDHFVPLELGGAPRDAANLWPEPRDAPTGDTATSKDGVETKLKNLVCNGTTTLTKARDALIANWQTAVAAVS